MTKTAGIDRVTTADGREILLTDLPCDLCGSPGCPFTAIAPGQEDDWGFFCSWECRQNAITVDGQPLTPELREETGIVFIGPGEKKPDFLRGMPKLFQR